MLVLNLSCNREHRFEGWFGSADDFESQLGRGLVGCPICASTEVQRLPSAPRLNVSHLRAGAAEPKPASPPDPQQQIQQAALQAVQQLLSRTEDVGERFAEEARRIHYGEVEQRGIRGRASRDEAVALAEEGIAVMALALPEALKGPLQ
jgi:hypothetical protein